MYTELNINKIYLMLGQRCNFSCRYCIQEAEKETERENGHGVSLKVLNYIRHLIKIRPYKKIGKLTVMFWGGEPLIYFDQIKAVVAALGDGAAYAMVSNGALLTEEVVAFCNQHDIHYVLSNDGPNTVKTRGENLLEDERFLALFKKLQNKAVDAVISAYNQDYQQLWEYLDGKVPGIQVYTELLQCTWNMPQDLYQFDFPAYRKSLRKAARQAHADILRGHWTREVQLLAPCVKEIMRVVEKNGEDEVKPFPRCGQIRHAMNVDTQGEVYACHNFSEQIGAVDEEYETLLARYDARLALDSTCGGCAYLAVYRGGCPYVKASAGKECCCEMRKIFFAVCAEFIAGFAHVLEEVDLG